MAAAAGVNTQGNFAKGFGQIGADAYSVDFEQEADYVGLYLARRGGYSINNAADFWRRAAVEKIPEAITLSTTHPSTPERFVALNKTIREIQAKQAAGQPLVPNIEQPEPASAAQKTGNGFN